MLVNLWIYHLNHHFHNIARREKLTAITAEINAILDGYAMPEGYTAEITGSYSQMMESFSDLLLALLVALGLVYFILASQFESFLMSSL